MICGQLHLFYSDLLNPQTELQHHCTDTGGHFVIFSALYGVKHFLKNSVLPKPTPFKDIYTVYYFRIPVEMTMPATRTTQNTINKFKFHTLPQCSLYHTRLNFRNSKRHYPSEGQHHQPLLRRRCCWKFQSRSQAAGVSTCPCDRCVHIFQRVSAWWNKRLKAQCSGCCPRNATRGTHCLWLFHTLEFHSATQI